MSWWFPRRPSFSRFRRQPPPPEESGRMRVALPFRGEFGLKLRFHVPRVHALAPDVACIEPGEEALYPSAKQFVMVDRNADDARRDVFSKDSDYLESLKPDLLRRFPEARLVQTGDGDPELRFVPRPFVDQGDFTGDVVVCPRRRNYGASKNWTGWGELVGDLSSKGLRVWAAGAPDSSETVPCPRTWDYERFLDATIAAMLAAKVVVATDAGLAHLAVLCGRPLVLIASSGGLVAPGPVIELNGKRSAKRYWPVRLEEYYLAANHLKAPIRLLPHGWERPEDVIAEVLGIIAADRVTAGDG